MFRTARSSAIGMGVLMALAMGADIVGAKGLDLAGAELHPFFQTHAEPVGHFRFLAPELASAAEGPYRHLVATPGGHLLWLAGPDRRFQQMSPSGPTYTFQVSDCSPMALVRNAKDQLWVFGRDTCCLLDLRGFETVPAGQPLKPLAAVRSASAADPLAVAGGPGMSGWVSVPGTLHHCEPKIASGTLTRSQCTIPSLTRPHPSDRTVPGQDGTTLVTFGPARESVGGRKDRGPDHPDHPRRGTHGIPPPQRLAAPGAVPRPRRTAVLHRGGPGPDRVDHGRATRGQGGQYPGGKGPGRRVLGGHPAQTPARTGQGRDPGPEV